VNPNVTPTVTPVNPTVNPATPNPPPPSSNTAGFRVLILVDPSAAMNTDQINAVNSTQVRSILNAKCMKDSSGQSQWHRWDITEDVSKQTPEWQQLMSASQGNVKSNSLTLPVLCVEQGSSLSIYEVTIEAALIATLNSVFGG
jgi:hypothetical protein